MASLFRMRASESDDWIEFPHLRIMGLKQTFEILDGENATRSLDGAMHRDIIGTYYNYELDIMPENTETGMKEYNHFVWLCSTPRDYWYLEVPDDVYSATSKSASAHTKRVYKAYITSGGREMKKYNYRGTDYWGGGTFNFISMNKAR